jgi:amino acid adenylation domain-containing protein
MSFWRQMPAGMLLRSGWRSSNIAHPNESFTLDEFAADHQFSGLQPIPVETFIQYGQWFQRQVAADLDSRRVLRVERTPSGFQLALDDGTTMRVHHLVVAAGIASFAFVPPQFQQLPQSLASHSATHADLSQFQGRRVVVIGGGQSALESAALLHEAGADVEVITRASAIKWLGGHSGPAPTLRRLAHRVRAALSPSTDVGYTLPAAWIAAHPRLCATLRADARQRFIRYASGPAVAGWLRDRVGQVRVTLRTTIASAAPSGSRLRLRLDDGSARLVDHVLFATGYRVDISRYPFLDDRLKAAIDTVDGSPKLSAGFESSVRRLHFIGATAAYSFGPLFRFVSGTRYTGRVLAKRIQETPQSRPSVHVTNERDTAPLSFQQQQLWLHAQLAGDAPIYTEAYVVERQGPLDVAVLERAFGELVRRHEAWRTTFAVVDGEPRQRVGDPFPFSIPMIDLTNAADDRAQRVEVLLKQLASVPFDLASGPLIRVLAVRLRANEHRVCVAIHHLLFDGGTFREVFLPELIAIYDAFARDQPWIAHEPRQYTAFTEWQRHALTPAMLDDQLNYWRQRLNGAVPTAWFVDASTSAGDVPFRGRQHTFALSAPVSSALRRMSRECSATLYMTILAAWVALLARCSGSDDDVVIGTVAAARRPAEFDNALGYFINTLTLRVQVNDDPLFVDLIQRVRSEVLSALSHADVPFDRVVRDTMHRRDAIGQHLFSTLFSFDTERPLADGWALSRQKIDLGVAKSPLELTIVDTGTELHGRFVFETNLVQPETVALMASRLCLLVGAVVADQEQRLSALPLLTDAERQTVLIDWNRTRTEYPGSVSVHELFEAQAAQSGDAVALACGGRTLSYRELNERAARMAARLRAAGVRPRMLVGVCVERSPDTIVALLAILKAGAGFLALDPSYPMDRLRFMVRDAGVSLIVCDGAVVNWMASTRARVVSIDTLTTSDDARSSEFVSAAAASDRVAYVAYTSGSTGEPKGVAVPDRAIVRLVVGTTYVTIRPEDVMLHFAPLGFDASTFEIWGALLNGARLAVPPPSESWLEQLDETIRRERVSVLWLTTAAFNEFVDWPGTTLESLRLILTGGEIFSAEHGRRLLRRWRGTVINAYGPTENTTFSTTFALRDPEGIPNSVPIGRPISNSTTYVLDRHRNPVPIGVAGELYVGGDGLALEYVNRPELTAERFVPHPFDHTPGACLYRTGDRVRYREDGNLEFLGRIDRQVKVRGFRVEPGEIEAAISRQAGVAHAAVVTRGEAGADKQLVAYVAADRERITAHAVRTQLRQVLPAYMIPSTIVIVPEIPMTPSGKLDRGALDAAREAADAAPAIEAPGTAVEDALAVVWREVLGVSTVSVTDNFFESGGDSLRAVRLFAAIERRFGCRLPLATLFRAPTIRELAPLLPEPLDVSRDAEHTSVSSITVQPGHRIGGGVRHAAAEKTDLIGHGYADATRGSVSLPN